MSNMLRILLILGFICLNVTAFRLPETTRPFHYEVALDTSLDTFTFEGSVVVNFTSSIQTNNVTLHSKNLTITDVIGVTTGMIVHSVVRNETEETITIVFTQNMLANIVYEIELIFNGTLGTGNVGFYRASYVNAAGVTRYLAVTHFEATNARRAFPCFDEPSIKATFRIALIRNMDYSTTTNMNLERTYVHPFYPTKYIDVYNTSVPMSTYLVAFLVSDYSRATMPNRTAGEYNVFGRPALISRNEGNYSLYVGRSVITEMINFTNIAYPLIKMDQVAVPNEYFKIGAMENWGMVTYRERYLMHNDTTNTASETQTTLTIIAHEFAHQWFGNLVTPKWWKYIWLNEGFATYFEMYIGSLLEPDWNLMEQFLTAMMHKAFDDDAFESSRPMTRDVVTPAEIDGIYDTIVYEKAGSVIRMAENFLGATVFQNGLRNYLNAWQYNNSEPQYLYNSWQAALPPTTSLNVTNILSTWETQSGFPVVNVTRTSSTNISLSQERFLLNNATSNDNSRWIIPIDWVSGQSQSGSIIWLTDATTVNINVNILDWLIVNRDRKGFYRVNYDERNWNLLANQLANNFTNITTLNRAQLVDDSFNLARSGRLRYSIALDIGAYVTNETEYVPILTFSTVFGHLHRISLGSSFQSYIRSYGIEVFEGIFNRTGFNISNSDTHLEKLTMVNILTWLCNLDHPSCRNNSSNAFTRWVQQSIEIQPDAQNFIYCNGVRDGSENSWNAVFQAYNNIAEDTHRSRLATALGCTTNSVLANRLLQNITSATTPIGPSDRVSAITSVFTNNFDNGVDLVLDFLTTNYQVANDRIGSMPTIVKGVASRITTNQQYARFRTFVSRNAINFTSSMNETINGAVTTIDFNLNWINETYAQFNTYFDRSSSNIIYVNFVLLLCGAYLSLLY